MEKKKTIIPLQGINCAEEKPGPSGIIIFGASGDLTHRKLIPALFNLSERGLMPDDFFVIGCGRAHLPDAAFRQTIRDTLTKEKQGNVEDFIHHFFFISGDYHDTLLYQSLIRKISELNTLKKTRNYIVHLATPPFLYSIIVEKLGSSGMIDMLVEEPSQFRVVIEKPFGFDLESAVKLDDDIHHVLDEHQIYRIDHYLGKETVQNILIFRFANAIFEPIWNRRYIDHIQITVAETLGVEHRAGYFEHTGLIRDMVQNHMLQMVSLVAMEPPVSFDADCVRDEKVKLLRAIRPFPLDDLNQWLVRGQYGSGVVEGKGVPGYRQERGVAPDSQVETFVAAKLLIDNWRWQGVPFYIRIGKCLPMKVSEIVIVFKEVPHSIFTPLIPDKLAQNMLILNVQPDEGVSLKIQAKIPGSKHCMGSLNFEFNYRAAFGFALPDAYERLLLDCMIGDQTLFIRQDDMIIAWSLITPVLNALRDNPKTSPLNFYDAGLWGPVEARNLISQDDRSWRLPETGNEDETLCLHPSVL
jgi:glucose-6-phosphate 1-dehydrogenase